MGVPTGSSGAEKMYCPDYHGCGYEIKRQEMSVEQQFYLKIARQSESIEKPAEERVRDWFKAEGWDR